MRLAELIVHLKNEKSCLKFQCVACHQPACALCACGPFMRVCMMVLIGDAKQAEMSGPVETGLTEPAATAL